MKTQAYKTPEERERDAARWYMWATLFCAILFGGGCLVAALTRESESDWFPVIWLGVMAGICAYAAAAIFLMDRFYCRRARTSNL